jgi:hypothetical protein
MGSAHRKDARAIIIGIVSPIASLMSSLALVAITGAQLPVIWIAMAGAALSGGFIICAHLQGRAYNRSLEGLLLGWYKEHTERPEASLDEAIEEAKRSDDRRISDMAREVGRRRRRRRRKS